jgi:hypothetical protein
VDDRQAGRRVALSGWHGFLSKELRLIHAGASVRTGKFWRMTNEIPFLIAIVMVLSVTTQWTFGQAALDLTPPRGFAGPEPFLAAPGGPSLQRRRSDLSLRSPSFSLPAARPDIRQPARSRCFRERPAAHVQEASHDRRPRHRSHCP